MPTAVAPKAILSQTHPDNSPRIVAHPDRSEHQQSPKPEHSKSRDADSIHRGPIPFETILQTDFGHTQIGITEINDPVTWSSFWQQNASGITVTLTDGTIVVSPIPKIDFKTHTVLAASPGMEGSPGYMFSINQVTEEADQVIVDATLTTPGSGCIWIQVITFPEQIIVITKTDTPAILSMNTVQAPPCPF